jgi:hypothetical protein
MQENASNIILGIAGPSDGFTIKYGIFRFKLKIKPLTAKQLIEISKEVSKISPIDETKDGTFPALMAGVNDIKYIASVIAIATGTKWRRLVARAILNLDLKDIKALFSIVHKQSDPSPYFFFIILARGRMNLLNPPVQSSAEKVSSAG